MICPNCGKETKGIKLNGKIFCTFCGEVVKDPAAILEESYEKFDTAPKAAATPKTTHPEPKVIHPDGSESFAKDDQGVLEAEKEILEVIEKKIQKDHSLGKTNIGKHNRKRVDQSYNILPGEPNPILEPELVSPHDSLVEDRTETSEPEQKHQTNFPLMPKEDKDHLKQKHKNHRDIFKTFLEETGSAVSYKPKKKKGIRAKKHTNRKLVWILLATIAFSGFLGGLIYYVNVIAINEEKIIQNIESSTTLIYKKPSGPILGYQISYLSESRNDFVRYYYTKKGDRKTYLSIDIQKTNYKTTDIQEKIITPLNTSYTVTSSGGLDFWQTNTNQIFVVSEGILYSFSYTDDLTDEKAIQYAQEMLL